VLVILKRVVGASLVGTAIEWYDFFIYSTTAALVFGKQFFPWCQQLPKLFDNLGQPLFAPP